MKKWLIIITVCIVAAGVAALLLFRGVEPVAPVEQFSELLRQENIQKPNILLITLDTTRADKFGCYGNKKIKTPFMDSIARDGVLFERCISPAALTLPSHASIMTGLYPTFHGIRVNGNTALSRSHQTLAELLAGQGYQCGAFIAAFVLDGRWGLKQGFHHYDDQFDLKKYKRLDLGHVQRPGPEVLDAAFKWMDTSKDKPFFSWIHLYDPHTPYEPPEPYRSMYHTGDMAGLYDGEIAYTDTLLGRCTEWLEQNNLDKNTILVIVGDHGEGLGDHGEETHGYYIYEYAVHVPFVIKSPGLKGKRIPAQVSTIDIYSTLLEMSGIQVPRENQGKSLLPAMFAGETGQRGETEEDAYLYCESMTPNIQYGWAPLYGIHAGQYKYIDAPRPELYDLSKDPKELNNLVRRFPGKVKTYKRLLDKIMADTSEGAPEPETANLDQQTLKRLATLGYVGGLSTKKRGRRGKGRLLADPKDKLEIFKAVSLASEHIARDKHSEAAASLEAVLKKDRHIPQAKLLLSTCYVELNRPEEAKTILDQMLKDDPNNLEALISMANILSSEGKDEDVITLCKKALAVDDRNTQAHNLIGEVFMGRKDHQGALPHLRRAAEIQPKLTQIRQNLAACMIGLKQYGEAETILNRIVQETPKFPLAHFHLGLLNEEQGNGDRARDFYEKELEVYKDSVPARFNLGKLMLAFGDIEGYITRMEEVVKLAPKMAEGYLFLARGLLRRGSDLDRTLELVEKGIAHAKTAQLKAFGYFLTADIYSRKKMPQKVQEALKQANYYKERQKE